MPSRKTSNNKPSEKDVQKHVNTQADLWWSSGSLGDVEVEKEIEERDFKQVPLPNGIGMMNLFKKPILLRLPESVLLSACDDNNKMCITLTDAEYELVGQIEEVMGKMMIDPLKCAFREMRGATFGSQIHESESGTENKYVKVKAQDRGTTRTIGINLDGSDCVSPADSLNVVGSKGSFMLRLEGVYITNERCGVMVKLDMFRIKSHPTEEEIEERKDVKRTRYDEDRKQALANF